MDKYKEIAELHEEHSESLSSNDSSDSDLPELQKTPPEMEPTLCEKSSGKFAEIEKTVPTVQHESGAVGKDEEPGTPAKFSKLQEQLLDTEENIQLEETITSKYNLKINPLALPQSSDISSTDQETPVESRITLHEFTLTASKVIMPENLKTSTVDPKLKRTKMDVSDEKATTSDEHMIPVIAQQNEPSSSSEVKIQLQKLVDRPITCIPKSSVYDEKPIVSEEEDAIHSEDKDIQSGVVYASALISKVPPFQVETRSEEETVKVEKKVDMAGFPAQSEEVNTIEKCSNFEEQSIQIKIPSEKFEHPTLSEEYTSSLEDKAPKVVELHASAPVSKVSPSKMEFRTEKETVKVEKKKDVAGFPPQSEDEAKLEKSSKFEKPTMKIEIRSTKFEHTTLPEEYASPLEHKASKCVELHASASVSKAYTSQVETHRQEEDEPSMQIEIPSSKSEYQTVSQEVLFSSKDKASQLVGLHASALVSKVQTSQVEARMQEEAVKIKRELHMTGFQAQSEEATNYGKPSEPSMNIETLTEMFEKLTMLTEGELSTTTLQLDDPSTAKELLTPLCKRSNTSVQSSDCSELAPLPTESPSEISLAVSLPSNITRSQSISPVSLPTTPETLSLSGDTIDSLDKAEDSDNNQISRPSDNQLAPEQQGDVAESEQDVVEPSAEQYFAGPDAEQDLAESGDEQELVELGDEQNLAGHGAEHDLAEPDIEQNVAEPDAQVVNGLEDLSPPPNEDILLNGEGPAIFDDQPPNIQHEIGINVMGDIHIDFGHFDLPDYSDSEGSLHSN
ncbi:enolase-phosphatase E1-like [Periplaneta americana]|uniref:enolase-phosphatase E1-like n=1 Tax=Periplaneta americana TaxID=6978 RepID=UPI0037E8253B